VLCIGVTRALIEDFCYGRLFSAQGCCLLHEVAVFIVAVYFIRGVEDDLLSIILAHGMDRRQAYSFSASFSSLEKILYILICAWISDCLATFSTPTHSLTSTPFAAVVLLAKDADR